MGMLIGNLFYGAIFDNDVQYAYGSGIERDSPQNWIPEQDIKVYNSGVVINVKNPEWARFADTNSMDPLFDEDANAIEIIPESVDDIEVGDIVSYKYNDISIVHRVVEKGIDEQGVYFIMKGDNNSDDDPYKVRFDQIQRVVVAIIY